jgi:hypothetical protein
VDGHLHRHDSSRWIEDVFRDGILAVRVRAFESGVGDDSSQDVVGEIEKAIRAGYEAPASGISTRPESRAS